MENLNVLSNEVLVQIILDLDYELTTIINSRNTEFVIQNLQNQLNAAYRDYEGMNDTRLYWKEKAMMYQQMLKENDLLGYRKVSEPVKKEEPKRFKINIVKNGKMKEYVKPEKVEEDKKVEYKPKTTSKHEVKSSAGNISGTPHSAHKTKDEVLVGIFPDGNIIEFDSVNEAKSYIQKTYKEFKKSPLTNISRAARQSGFYANNGGMAYNVKWSYKNKEDEYTVDGVRIER